MNKKLGRLLRPSMGMYFVFLLAFCAVALLAQQYLLAAAESVIAGLLYAAYLLDKKERRHKLQEYAKKLLGEQARLSRGEAAFPLMLVRLGDGGVVFANDSFQTASGFENGATEHQIEDIIPGFQTDWLTAGKNEYPYDVTMKGRRYRVYGSVVKADDPDQTLLGLLQILGANTAWARHFRESAWVVRTKWANNG